MLEVTWFVLWVLLWAIYLMLDGYDFGAGVLSPFLAKTEAEKKETYLAAGPFWDGNEVWLIAAGGITFAAFPKAYAVLFSAMYAPLLLFLFILIFRAAAIEFQLHMSTKRWKHFWENVYFIVNILAPVVLGVFFANLFTGLPIDANGVYKGTLLTFFTPYTLVGGVLFLALFTMHGGLWLILKTHPPLRLRAVSTVRKLWPVVCILLVIFIWMSYFYTGIYDRYIDNPKLILLPALLLLEIIGIWLFLRKETVLWAWFFSALGIMTFLFWGLVGVFPNLIISTLSPEFSVTIFNAASSPLTLKIMLVVAIIFVPIVIAYQLWTHKVFAKK